MSDSKKEPVDTPTATKGNGNGEGRSLALADTIDRTSTVDPATQKFSSTDEVCGNCRFYWNKGGVSECHFDAPKAHLIVIQKPGLLQPSGKEAIDNQLKAYGFWPPTPVDMWCGCFEFNKPARERERTDAIRKARGARSE